MVDCRHLVYVIWLTICLLDGMGTGEVYHLKRNSENFKTFNSWKMEQPTRVSFELFFKFFLFLLEAHICCPDLRSAYIFIYFWNWRITKVFGILN